MPGIIGKYLCVRVSNVHAPVLCIVRLGRYIFVYNFRSQQETLNCYFPFSYITTSVILDISKNNYSSTIIYGIKTQLYDVHCNVPSLQTSTNYSGLYCSLRNTYLTTEFYCIMIVERFIKLKLCNLLIICIFSKKRK